MTTNNTHLLKSNLKHLRLPTMGAEFEKLAREAAQANEGYEQYLLRLTELEVAARSANAIAARIHQAGRLAGRDAPAPHDDAALPGHDEADRIEHLGDGHWLDVRHDALLVKAEYLKLDAQVHLAKGDVLGIRFGLGAEEFGAVLLEGWVFEEREVAGEERGCPAEDAGVGHEG